jgi:hypothetical protein
MFFTRMRPLRATFVVRSIPTAPEEVPPTEADLLEARLEAGVERFANLNRAERRTFRLQLRRFVRLTESRSARRRIGIQRRPARGQRPVRRAHRSSRARRSRATSPGESKGDGDGPPGPPLAGRAEGARAGVTEPTSTSTLPTVARSTAQPGACRAQ